MARQAGMTLIELTVVLLILIGLAGLMVPYVGGFLDKTHDSTGVASMKEIDKQLLSYAAMYGGHPDGMDSLVEGSGETTPGKLVSYLMNTMLFSAVTMDSGHVSQLDSMGIQTVMDMLEAPGAGNYTFASSEAERTLVENDKLAAINAMMLTKSNATCPDVGGVALTGYSCLDSVLDTTGTADTNDYVVFGIGNSSTMIGRTMNEAPVHFAKEGGQNAGNKYNRMLAVYEVQKGGTSGHMMAKYMGVVMPMMKIEGFKAAMTAAYAGD